MSIAQMLLRSTICTRSGFTRFIKERTSGTGQKVDMKTAGPEWKKLTPAQQAEYTLKDRENTPVFMSAKTLYEKSVSGSSFSALPKDQQNTWTQRADELAKKFLDKLPNSVKTKSAFSRLSQDHSKEHWLGADKKYWGQVADEMTTSRHLEHGAFVRFVKNSKETCRDAINASWKKLPAAQKRVLVSEVAAEQGKTVPPKKSRGKVALIGSSVSPASATGSKSSKVPVARKPKASGRGRKTSTAPSTGRAPKRASKGTSAVPKPPSTTPGGSRVIGLKSATDPTLVRQARSPLMRPV